MKVLLTSFDVWLDHHTSNASDDLLEILIQRNLYPEQCHFLRRIKVDFQRAPICVIAAIREVNPDLILCCGMAETRTHLSLESNGKFGDEILRTPLDLPTVLEGTIATEISHDAGNFVCNHLYYSVLKYIQENSLASHCLFMHVPLLGKDNLDRIVQDFWTILNTLLQGRFSTTSASPASTDGEDWR